MGVHNQEEKTAERAWSAIVLALICSVLASGAILTSTRANADTDTAVTTTSITVAATCSLESTLDTAHTATIPNGVYSGGSDYYPDGIGQTTLKAFCNDAEGFSIYAVGYSEEVIGNTYLKDSNLDASTNIVTGTATSGDTSNWAMKIGAVSGTYTPIVAGSTEDTEKETGDPDFSNYTNIPSKYTRVAYKNSGTDVGPASTGSRVTTTYAAYVSRTQPAGTYEGKVKYTLVHPASEEPLSPQTPTQGCINYFANASTAVGTMGCQSVSSDGASVALYASNFSRDGYGFAGWSDAYDYATNQNAHFYGPNEDITVPTGTTANGLSLYAVWVKSTGSMQSDATTACNKLTAANYNIETGALTANLSSITALTDDRDGDTYAIAKLSDGNCWMIENLRLADNHQEDANTVPTTLTTTNTNNPLNDNDATNPTVTLKHNYADAETHNTLSATSNVAYNADTAPNGWCTDNSAACDDQSRLRTDNTANRVFYSTTQNMSTDANLYSYGNYYNWYSATAGRGTYSTGSNVVAAGDLCPANWHLPYGGNGTGTKGGKTSGGFSYLDTMMGGTGASSSTNSVTSATMSTYWRQFPNNFVYSGNVNGASLYNRGSYGFFWSSTAYSRSYAYSLNFSSSYVNPGTNDYSGKYCGWIVRCVVAPGA